MTRYPTPSRSNSSLLEEAAASKQSFKLSTMLHKPRGPRMGGGRLHAHLKVVHDKGGGLSKGIADFLLTGVHSPHHSPHCLQPIPLLSPKCPMRDLH